ncbi:MAG: DUF4412 domain-containing protein [Verrucomicrobiota bacterium]
MKPILNRLGLVAALFVCSAQFLHAQMPGDGSGPMSTAMLKLFGKNTNFTAKSEVQMLDQSQKETLSATLPMAMLVGKMRTEMDIGQMKSVMISPQVLAQMKQMGADKTISLVRPDKQATYLIYPSLKAYVEMPMSEADKQALIKEPKIEKTSLGKETIDGHPCVKNKVVIKDDKNLAQEATTWNATDLKDFPIRIQAKEKDTTVIMKFKEVQLAKPDAKQFELPADYKKYESLQELQQVMMQKMLGTPKK